MQCSSTSSPSAPAVIAMTSTGLAPPRYQVASVVAQASRLERPLLIIHGTTDDNVYFAHALKMHEAFFRAGRDHDFVVLAGSTHMVADADVARALEGRIMRFLARGLEGESSE